VGEGWGGGSLLLHESANNADPHPQPLPTAEVGFYPTSAASWMPISGKPEIGGGERAEFMARLCINIRRNPVPPRHSDDTKSLYPHASIR
jgi:hypothetical protein